MFNFRGLLERVGGEMALRLIWYLIFLVLLSGCEEKPDEAYRPPIFSGKAYVLGAADHVAIVDLKSTELRRLKLDRMAVDLALLDTEIYILSENGALGILPKKPDAQVEWQHIAEFGKALAPMPPDRLLLLTTNELLQLKKSGEIEKRFPVPKDTSSVMYDAEKKRVFLVNRTGSFAGEIDLGNGKLLKKYEHLGNSLHHGLSFPGREELWLAEGNEYMDGKPYGVGFQEDGPAMAGTINVIDLTTGRQQDNIFVGGNVVDLALSPDRSKVYAAVSRYPEYKEASLSIVGSESRRPQAELRLCYACHETEGVEIDNWQAEVRALVVVVEQVQRKE